MNVLDEIMFSILKNEDEYTSKKVFRYSLNVEKKEHREYSIVQK